MLTRLGPEDQIPAGCGVVVVNESVTLYLLLRGVVDPATEIAKLGKKTTQVEKQASELKKKDGDAGVRGEGAAERQGR